MNKLTAPRVWLVVPDKDKDAFRNRPWAFFSGRHIFSQPFFSKACGRAAIAALIQAYDLSKEEIAFLQAGLEHSELPEPLCDFDYHMSTIAGMETVIDDFSRRVKNAMRAVGDEGAAEIWADLYPYLDSLKFLSAR